MRETAAFVFLVVLLLSLNVGAEENFSNYPEIIRLPFLESQTGIDAGVQWRAYKLSKNDTPVGLFGDLSEDAMRFNRLDRIFWKEGVIIRMPSDISQIKGWTPMSEAFEKCGKGLKRCAVISLADQFLGIYEKGGLISSYPVSTGSIEMICGRPEGTKSCRTPAMETYVRGRYIKTFSYPYRVWMWYALDIGRGRFIHSGNLPGHPDSHGCIRLFKRDARKVYNQIRINTKVFVVNDI